MGIEKTITGLGNASKNVVIGIAILILTMFVSIYGINTLYEQPDYNDFCGDRIAKPFPDEERICPSVCTPMYEIKNNECISDECGSGCGADGVNTFEKLSQCEIVLSGKNCYDSYESANHNYSKKVFLTAIPFGIILIAVGAFAFSLNSVGVGLMLGGIGTLIYGAGGYWRYTENWLRFLISLIGLIVLIWIAYWFNKRK